METLLFTISQTISILLTNFILTKQKHNYLLFLIKILFLTFILQQFNQIIFIYLALIIIDYLLLNVHDSFNYILVVSFNLFIVIFYSLYYLFNIPCLLLVSSLITMGLSYLCLNKGKTFFNTFTKQQYYPVLLINLLLLVILSLNNYLFKGPTATLFIVVTTIISILIEWIIIQIYQNQIDNCNLNQLNQIYQTTKQYLNDLKTMQYQIENYQHDFTKHLMIINNLIDTDLNQTKNYLSQLTKKANSIKPVINSCNQNLNLILNFIISKNPDLNFKITTSITSDIEFDYQLCSMLLKLINLATKETKKANQRAITIKIISKKQMLLITIKHPITNEFKLNEKQIEEMILHYIPKINYQYQDNNITYQMILNL